MDLYSIKNKTLDSVELKSFEKEQEIQELVESNTDLLFGVEFISTEFSIYSQNKNFRIDSLCFDNESNSFVIIEYKKGDSYSVIDQGYSYLSTMLNNKDSFIIEYCKRKKVLVDDVEVDWSQSRIIFVSPSFNTYQKNSVNFQDIPFELWEIKRYNNDTVVLNQHMSRSKESIKKVVGGKDTVIDKVNNEVQVLSEEDTMKGKKVDEKIKEVYYKLKDKIISWDDISFNPKKNYISIKRNKKIFVFLNFRKSFIRVHILSKIKTKWDGTRVNVEKSTKEFILDDPKDMFTTWENDYKKLFSYDLKDTKDLDYFILMIQQKYNSV